MEFPHIGKNCSYKSCNKLDFLPMKCGACRDVFCSDHFAYSHHECPAPNTRDVQVPVCPLCGAPVPGRRDEPPDVAVGAHIDNQCMSDPARERRKKTEDEALAHALAASLQESASLHSRDTTFARALSGQRVGGEQNSRCSIS
ncbi:hypothetical protein MSG28_009261 [Choristoneura fumiferana]|uniref:Uncharacterized protein n=2 Tax=Choristoneura fumiferana TaxID=7141 RepID=A0ACC0KXB8_CHOFU|nr:hypothetical protein MSG28_009261 [Choristoneura fumiferana]KAI8440980.1 hypothetical protein MSG28_009261 [Choristoneura fumiferana]